MEFQLVAYKKASFGIFFLHCDCYHKINKRPKKFPYNFGEKEK